MAQRTWRDTGRKRLAPGYSIPKKIVKSLGWKAGHTIIVHVDYNEGKIILEKKK